MEPAVGILRPSEQVRGLASFVAGATTDEHLHRLLEDLTKVLGANRAYITEIIDDRKSQTLAAWEDNERAAARELDITGSPCSTITRDGVQVVNCDLAAKFPNGSPELGCGAEGFVGSPVLDHFGNVIGQICVFSDHPLQEPEMASALIALAAVRVSAELEHRQQRESMLRQQRQLETLLGNLPGMAYRGDCDRDRRMRFVSHGCEALTGYAIDEIVDEARGWSELVHPEDRDRVARSIDRALASTETFEIQYRIISRDGMHKWVWERGCRIPGDCGLPDTVEGFISDVTERKDSEAALTAVERRFRAVFDQRHQLTAILSVDGIVLEANQNSLRFSGLNRDSVIGQYYWDTPWWNHSAELQEKLKAAIADAASGRRLRARFEATCPRADGTMATLDFSLRSVIDSAGGVAFLVPESHDITEQRQAEEEARSHREKIAHVTRLSALGQMAAGIAHEINQPLTAISLFAQAGRRLIAAEKFDRMEDVCERLNEHALRASAVVERMQSMTRQRSSMREVTDCNDIIKSVIKLAEAEARIHDIQIEFEKPEYLPDVCVDVIQIQQVALNLLRNGMEAMRASGDLSEATLRVRSGLRDHGDIEVGVIDSGCGVDEAQASKLFKPFTTTKESGMGMGVSISEAIVKSHGGEIGFHNNDSGGATFWFTLPAATREARDG